VRIFTGAPVPAGADLVVIQEDAARDGETVNFEADERPAGPTPARPAATSSPGDVLLEGWRSSTPGGWRWPPRPGAPA
jgi:molybdopterin molybdotransferase